MTMDKQQEQLQFLGFVSIYKESFKIILKKPKIFTQITLAFILPLSCLALAYIELFKYFSPTTTINNTITSPPSQLPSSPKNSQLVTYSFLIKACIYISELIFSLLSTTAIIYTVACIRTNKEITFKNVLSVILKVWKRLITTILSKFFLIFVYMLVVIFIIISVMVLIFMTNYNTTKPGNLQAWTTISTMIMVVFLVVPTFYVTITWQLANVISVLENNCGLQALKKSTGLIKGKKGTAFAIVLVSSVCSLPIQLFFYREIYGKDMNVGVRILYGVVTVVVNSLFNLYGLVAETVFYFVCKSYHNEIVDKSILGDHLEGILVGYVPLKTEAAIEVEHLQV